MSKVFVRQKTVIFALVIILLLMLCVGLLVAILKGKMHHDNLFSTELGIQVGADTTTSSTINDTSMLPLKQVVTRSTNDVQSTTEADLSQTKSSWEHFRLPRHVVPVHYDLLLHPNLRNDTFQGRLNVTVNVTKTTKHVVLHSYKLVLHEFEVIQVKTKKILVIAKTFLHDPHEFLVIELKENAVPGLYNVYICFSGSLVGSIVGFYKSRYTQSSTNQTRFLATSKFQPTYARRAFPCFDEPSFKSTFNVSLVHEPHLIALSNMPAMVTETYDDKGLVVTTFQKSVPMVTYLACFIVCDFKYKETLIRQGKKFRVYATEEQVNKTEYALQFGSRVLEYFEEYFGIAYPLPKQDMVAIPDFVSGAMEHWGVITFRETNMLYDNFKSSPQNKQRVSTVISHEMAHMWFGNLVTMDWWDDLWLNEGFASYAEYKGVNDQHPDWKMMDHFIIEDMQSVMNMDSTMSSHPIIQPVSNPDEITSIFDGISYNKGASILRMLEFFTGEKNFRNGISRFLKKYQFKNARTGDLWEEIALGPKNQMGYNISTIMDTWTKQMGFPYLTVIRDSTNTSNFNASQKRFVKNPDLYQQMNESEKEYIWSVPLSYITAKGKTGIVWIHDENTHHFTIPASDSEWVKFNVNQTGYFIVNYDEGEWKRIVDLLREKHEELSPSDRSNLLFDTFLLAEAGHVNYDLLLYMTMYLKNETHLIPWETAYTSLVYLCQLLEYTDVNFLMKSYIRDLTKPLYEKLGWKEGGGHLSNLLRTTIIGLACHSGNQDCLNQASELLQNWTQGQSIPTFLRSLVYHYGMAEIGREEHWNLMWEKYLEEGSPQEKNALLYGLAHVRIPALIHRYLEFAMDETRVRKQDFFSVLSYVAGNPIGRPIVWNFIREKWTYLVDRFTLNDRHLGFAVNKICSYFTFDYELEEMKAFFKKYPEAGAGKRAREQALEKVQNNIKWLHTHKEDVKLWLQRDGVRAWLYYRLPSHVKPIHYDLTLHPLLSEDQFKGVVNITVKLKKTTDIILVHARQLDITVTEVMSHDHAKVEIANTFYYEPNEYWVIQTSQHLPIGKYFMHFKFNGNLTGSLVGLYKSSYVDSETKEKRFLATTQFQSTYARRAFPCFDEPVFKSTFSVNIIHNRENFAISNTMEMETREIGNNQLETKFEKSVPMVTYLVCIIVCDFKYKETYTANGIRFRVYASPHNINKTDYALKIGSEVLTFFEKYFDVPYPLKKQDMIAIPDFKAGAMENWGLITYRERILLIDETETSISEKIAAASTIVHELAHMWFGNLVTMKWWDDLWLNEGFASYMEYKGIEHVEPTWDSMEQVAAEDQYTALTLDGEVNSHPIVQRVHDPNEISELFDTISYSKGSSILRMLESLMGVDFQQGISSYLKKYAFRNADTANLWDELTLSSKQALNITRIMDTWTRQMNYPYITVKRSAADPNIFLLKQQHFLTEPENKNIATKHSPFGFVWQVPMTYAAAEDSENHFYLLNSTKEVELKIQNSKWVKFNQNFTGFFLVNYGEEDWKKFTEILLSDHNVFSPSNRANLLYDSFALARAGHLPYNIPLQMTFYLKKETHIVPWKVARNMMGQISVILEEESDVTYDMFKEHIRSLTRDHFRKFKLNDTGEHLERRLRVLIVSLACNNGNFECLRATSIELKEWMNGKVLNPNLRSVIYSNGMQQNLDEVTWTFLWKKYLNESSSQEKVKLLYGLASTRNVTLLRRLLEYAGDESKVRRQDYFTVLSSISKNSLGHELVWEFITNNWTSLVERFTLNDRGLGRIIKSVGSRFKTEDSLKKVQNFFRHHPKAGAGRRSRAETIEIIKNNIKWITKHRNKLHDWLTDEVFMPWKNVRLPTQIIPTHYDIMIHPNISQGTFKGEVNVFLKVVNSTDYILIHSDELAITQSRLIGNNMTIPLEEEFPFAKNHFWVIKLKEPMVVNACTLKLDFSGKMQNDEPGLVKLSYTRGKTKEKRDFAATLFQPTYARRTFPCFDEPGMKAKFTITIVHEPEYFVISNMPEEATKQRHDGLLQTKFTESVPMVTYLVCFLVSDFKYMETEMSENRRVRIFAPPDHINQTLYALNFIPKMISSFEEYFGISYALPKLDFAAVPGYPALAMENWGLIIHKDNHLLPTADMHGKKLVTQIDQVVAHEIAHQWFGNLVTMKWWNDLWLNEGFATFAMFEAVREFHSFADEIAIDWIGTIMNYDATAKSHPIVYVVNNPEEINKLFDNISYKKGLAVLRMLRYIMKDDFRRAVTMYLKKNKFSNAATIDLYNELSYVSQMPINITEMMNTWTYQMGFPYIEIERSGNSFTAKQDRFFLPDTHREEKTEIQESPYGYVWKIPIICKDMITGIVEEFWLEEKNETFPLQAPREATLNFNPDFFGYYLINYDETGWESLIRLLKNNHTVFSILDRYNVLHNAFMLAKGEKLIYDIALDLTKYLKNEKEDIIWKLVTKEFLILHHNLVENTETFSLWRKYIAHITDLKLNDLLWDGRNNSDVILDVASLSCKSYSNKCFQKSTEFLQERKMGEKNFTLDFENLLHITISWYNGSENLWEDTWKEATENPDTGNIENNLAVTLAYIQSEELAERSLYKSLENSKISPAFFATLLNEMIYNPTTNSVVWDFLQENWEEFSKKLRHDADQISGLLQEICLILFKTKEQKAMMIQFFKSHTEISKDTQERCTHQIQMNIDWQTKYKQLISDWLRWNVAQ